jgi:hypothetical protein
VVTERSGTETRLVELLAVLSLATDLGVGRPLENELRVTVVAMRFGRTLDLDQEALRELLFVALLRWIGCTAHAHELALLFDDEIDAQRRAAWIDFTRPPEGFCGSQDDRNNRINSKLNFREFHTSRRFGE